MAKSCEVNALYNEEGFNAVMDSFDVFFSTPGGRKLLDGVEIRRRPRISETPFAGTSPIEIAEDPEMLANIEDYMQENETVEKIILKCNGLEGESALDELMNGAFFGRDVECKIIDSEWNVKPLNEEFELKGKITFNDLGRMVMFVTPASNQKLGDLNQPKFATVNCTNGKKFIYVNGQSQDVSFHELARDYFVNRGLL